MSGGTRSAVRRNRDRIRNRSDDEPPPPPSAAEILMEAEKNRRDQTRLLELIEQNTARQRNVVVSIQDFILLNPPVFECSSEPLEADDWLRSIERKLETAHVAPDDRVLFAVYFLEGAAAEWWENFVAMQPDGHVVTWQQFRDALRGYHILDEMMERKKEEFCNLTQGDMSIHEYMTEFNHLARYAQEDISTDARKQARFRKGLSPVIRHNLNLHEFVNFEDLVNDPSEMSMAMRCSKSLASMLVSLLHLLVRPLRNAGYGFQLVPFLHTLFQGHPTWCLNLLHQT